VLGCAAPEESASSPGPTETESNQWEQQPIPNSEADIIEGSEEEVKPGVTIQFGEEEDASLSDGTTGVIEDGNLSNSGDAISSPDTEWIEDVLSEEDGWTDTQSPISDVNETEEDSEESVEEDTISPDVDEEVEPEEENDEPDTEDPPPVADCSNTDCGSNATCSNTDSGPVCSCNSGFSEQGGNCADVNECSGQPCDSNAICINTSGGFDCAPCPFGHTVQSGECIPGYNLCGTGASQERSGGTWDTPLEAPYLPLVDEFSTSLSGESQANTYDCAPSTNESGPEVVYAFQLPTSGYFRADLTDGPGVDIDLHLLKNPSISGGVVSGCLARNDSSIEIQNLEAGEYLLVADTYVSSNPQPGEYRISIEWIPDGEWTTIPVAPGITWKRMRTTELPGDVQTIQMVEVDRQVGWDVEASPHNGCKTVSAYAPTLNALVGINGGFFNSSCGSLDLVKTNGVLHSTNEMTGYEQPTIGWNDGAPAQFSWIFPGQDFSGVNNGIGGFPSLVEASVPFAAVYPGEQVWSSGDWQPNPRSAMGFKNGHTMMFWTLDGRTDMGDGLSTPALAEALASWGAEYAMGLDGGGSTTLYIRDCSINSVVNFPSDNQKTDHKGMRSVSDGVYVR